MAAATAAIVTAANASEGAYFSQSWGWVALAFLVPTSVLLITDRATVPGRLRIAFALGMAALAAWIALSAVWSISSPASLREVERMLVYVGLALAVAIVARRGDGPGISAGALVGVCLISGYALATRLLPDRLDTPDRPDLPYRLSEPLGYWNSLGLLAAIGFLLALGMAAHGRRAAFAGFGGAVLPVLAVTLYFTFSRGATIALALGAVSQVMLDPRRLRLLWSSLVVVAPALALVVYASRQDALTTEDAPVAQAVREGHRLVAVLCIVVLCSAALALFAHAVSRRVVVSRRLNRVANVALGVTAAMLVVIGIAVAGGPSRVLSELEERFEAEPVGEVDLNDRLLSLSGTGRADQLRVAWEAANEQWVVGQGSGTFEYLWYENRRQTFVVRDGHSLYAETLAEIGLVGLSLLAATVVVPLVGAVRARRLRYVPAAAAAYVAWLAASAVDWHWEMVGVTTIALLVGSVALLGAERSRRGLVRGGVRGVAIVASVAVSALAVVSLVGNQALFAGREALAANDPASARDHARRAQALLFWSHEPHIVPGDAAAASGRREDALQEFREAIATDPRNWVAWLRLAQVARGAERQEAFDRVRELNPREQGLPDG